MEYLFIVFCLALIGVSIAYLAAKISTFIENCSKKRKNQHSPSNIIKSDESLKKVEYIEIKTSNASGFNSNLISYLFGIIFVIWGIAQLIAGYNGIVAYAGIGWAITTIVISLVFRFTLPITVAAFYGAMTVMGWPWYYALLFSAPGLALIVPSILMSILGIFKRN